uniref:Uncharacterized protein n=1 Tax=Arundo donax TaxID=35708 RepID=A0A0A9CK34_ARUDO
MEKIKWERDSRRLDSDCRIALNCDDHHDFIWTPIRAFKVLYEKLIKSTFKRI